MPASPHVRVRVDLERIRRNAAAVRAQTGVALLAVVKADAYGLGAERVSAAIADQVDGFFLFSLREAQEGQFWRRTGKTSIALGPAERWTADDFLAERVRPAVWTP